MWAATGPTAFDCSGLTQWAYKQAGINLPRTTRQQWAATTRISKDQLQPGDLIFYSNNKAAPVHPGRPCCFCSRNGVSTISPDLS